MNKAGVLEALQTEHDAMERAIAGLASEWMTGPVLANGWSVKDALAHIAAWEAELVTALYQGSRVRVPSIARAMADVDAWNAARYEENRDRPFDRVLSDWRGVRQALVRRLEEWDDAALAAELPWRPGVTLLDLIEANSYGHEREHRLELEARAGGAGE